VERHPFVANRVFPDSATFAATRPPLTSRGGPATEPDRTAFYVTRANPPTRRTTPRVVARFLGTNDIDIARDYRVPSIRCSDRRSASPGRPALGRDVLESDPLAQA